MPLQWQETFIYLFKGSFAVKCLSRIQVKSLREVLRNVFLFFGKSLIRVLWICSWKPCCKISVAKLQGSARESWGAQNQSEDFGVSGAFWLEMLERICAKSSIWSMKKGSQHILTSSLGGCVKKLCHHWQPPSPRCVCGPNGSLHSRPFSG